MNKILSMAYQSKALDATSMMVDMAKLPEKNVRVYLTIYLFWCKTCQQRYPPTEYSATAQKESLTHLDNMWSIWFRLSKNESCLLGVKLECKETLWKSNKLWISLTYHLIVVRKPDHVWSYRSPSWVFGQIFAWKDDNISIFIQFSLYFGLIEWVSTLTHVSPDHGRHYHG